MAAPHVTGLCGLIFTQHTDLFAASLRARVMLSADRIPALNGLVVSGGRINGWKALVADEYVDTGAPGGGNGEPGAPHNTLAAAVEDATEGGHILMVPGSFPEILTITKEVTLISTGPVTIGQ